MSRHHLQRRAHAKAAHNHPHACELVCEVLQLLLMFVNSHAHSRFAGCQHQTHDGSGLVELDSGFKTKAQRKEMLTCSARSLSQRGPKHGNSHAASASASFFVRTRPRGVDSCLSSQRTMIGARARQLRFAVHARVISMRMQPRAHRNTRNEQRATPSPCALSLSRSLAEKVALIKCSTEQRFARCSCMQRYADARIRCNLPISATAVGRSSPLDGSTGRSQFGCVPQRRPDPCRCAVRPLFDFADNTNSSARTVDRPFVHPTPRRKGTPAVFAADYFCCDSRLSARINPSNELNS
jgi:hypothetical protein